MAVNFELDFIQPILKDLQAGNYKSVDDYAKAVTKYYQKTIAKGAPQGVPTTLPSPAASGAPAPVSAGPGDAYTEQISTPSHLRMEKVVTTYYDIKATKIDKASLDYYKGSLERLIQDYKKARDIVEGLVPLILKLQEDVRQVPQKLDDLIKGVNVLYESYKKDLDRVVNNGTEINEEEREQVLTSFKSNYKDEADLMLFINQGDFSNPKQILATVKRFTTYVKKQEQKGTNTNDIVKNRFLGLLRDMVIDFANIASPEGFESVLLRFKGNKKDLKQGEKEIITKAESAVQFIKVIRFIVEPEIAKLKKEYKLQKEKVKSKFEQKIDNKKKLIAKRLVESKVNKKTSEKIKFIKKNVEDVKRYVKEKEDIIKKEVATVKAAKGLIEKSIKVAASVSEFGARTIEQVNSIKAQVEELEVQTTVKKKEATLEEGEVYYKEGLEVGAILFVKASKGLSEDPVAPVGSYVIPDATTVDGVTVTVGEKGKITGIARSYAQQNKKELRDYLNIQGLSKEFRVALEPIAQNTTTDFINIRNILQNTDKSYEKLFSGIESIERDVVNLEKDFNDLQDRINDGREKRGKDTQKKRRKRTNKVSNKKRSILDVFKFLMRLKAKLDSFIEKIEKWIKSQIIKKKKFIDRQAAKIQIAVINSLPKFITTESVETKAAAAKEQARLIELYKSRLQTISKKALAVGVVVKSATKLASNVSQSPADLSAGSNVKPLSDFSKGIFDFKTINVEANSPNYKRWDNWRKDFNKNISRYTTIDQLIGLAVVLKNELKKPNGTLFVEKLITNLDQVFNTEVGLNKTDYNKVINIFSTFIESPSNDPKQLTQAVKEIQTTLKGQTLKKFIGSANIITVLISIEREYLQKTRNHIKQVAAVTSKASELNSANEEGFKMEGDFNKKIQKLSKSAEGQGSFIVELIDSIDEEAKKLKQWIAKEKKELTKEIDNDLNREKKKLEEWFAKKSEALKRKFIKNDLVPQSVTYNVATNLFWTGATWVNNVGTTFQTLPIGAFKILRVDGKLDGVESSVRELARNLEDQLMQVKGLVIPNPATGIIPFTFVGYK